MVFIFQTFNLLPVLPRIENVELPLLVSGTDTKTARNKAQKALEAVGLGEYGHHKPAQLSGGERQRVTVARSLVNEPHIVWADEPTGSLDSETANAVMSLLTELNKKQSLTILLVTHNREVAELSNRIIHMKDGVISSEEKIN